MKRFFVKPTLEELDELTKDGHEVEIMIGRDRYIVWPAEWAEEENQLMPPWLDYMTPEV